jgi:hypothetical protein
MSHRFASLLLCVAGLSPIGPPQVAAEQAPTTAAESARTTPPPSTPLRVRGTIDEYDLETGVLSLSTANGVVRFPVAPSARIRRGSEKLAPSALKTLSGYRAAVRYSELSGKRTVESVNVFEQVERIVR